ncbi:hypothetical protein POJ06DRAFT_214141 [Lipomyces tetrasporus]|uniref:Uncharacterized protein n=1 Tax=Lipomyces tetrasporus TaxID=54092 RepID=A0AAD7VQC8_9ASCO|nr:uncharacterized protein POJ06DRAFT_214141 [Lipomyces tetrasporus]KAJ8097751.1 hypothetical protein POJ06DRAFT_214141 [Lipomyces tetrasporus]
MDDLPSSPEFLRSRQHYASSDSAVAKPSAGDSLPSSPYWTASNVGVASNGSLRSNSSSDRLSLHSSSPLRRSKSNYLGSSPNQQLARVHSTQSLRSSTRRGALVEDSESDSDQEDQTITANVVQNGRAKPRNFSAETVTESNVHLHDNTSIWEAVEDLRSRVVKLEMSNREGKSHAAMLESTMVTSSSSSTSLDLRSSPSRASTAASSLTSATHGHLRTALAHAREAVPGDLYYCLETAAVDLENLASKLPADRIVKLKMEALYRSLADLFIVLNEDQFFTQYNSSTSRPYSRQHQRGQSTPSIVIRSDPNPVPESDSGIASRLPVRAASRMRSSLETSQLPPNLRPASRLASRNDTLHGDEYAPTPAFDTSSNLNRRPSVSGTTTTTRPTNSIAMPRSLFSRDEGAYRPHSVMGMRAPFLTGRRSGMVRSSPGSISRGNSDRVD